MGGLGSPGRLATGIECGQLTNPKRGDNIARQNQLYSKGGIWPKHLMSMPINFSSTLGR
jgi:hypothetical protein